MLSLIFFFFQAEDGIRDRNVTGVQTCALPISVSRLQDKLGSSHRLFFLIGADSWAEIETWREWQRLLKICDLIVVTRPGYSLTERVAVEVIDVRTKSRKEIAAVLDDGKTPRVYFTDGARVDISATALRALARSND